MTTRFTVTGSPELEAKIGEQLAAISDDVQKNLAPDLLDCLALGGGYGRGEGGALVRDGVESPYNDYDLVLVHLAPRRALSFLRDIEKKHTSASGIHVEIMPLHRKRVPRLPHALTWFELGRGHKVLLGDPHGLQALTKRRIDQVHPAEWGRLLMNRAVGLVFARWVLAGEPCSVLGAEDPDAFVTRQVEKAWLALGDVWLSERNAYHHLVWERKKRFAQLLSDRPFWGDAYERAITFKLSPTMTRPRSELLRELSELSGLYAPRLRRRRASPLRPLVGLLATVRHVSPRRWLSAPPWAYPRERIRLAVSSELIGDHDGFRALVDSRERLIRLWSRYG